jgi:hypothetical protein
MALGSTPPLTEMTTRNHPGGKKRPARKAHNLTAICEPIVYKMCEPRPLRTLWASTASYKDGFISTLPFIDKLDDCDLLNYLTEMSKRACVRMKLKMFAF